MAFTSPDKNSSKAFFILASYEGALFIHRQTLDLDWVKENGKSTAQIGVVLATITPFGRGCPLDLSF